MKKLSILLAILLILPLVFAVNLEVTKTGANSVMIKELDKPVIFNLQVKNLGATDDFEFYNLLGFEMFPKGTTKIGNRATENVELKISPIGDFDYTGNYKFEYYIRGNDNTEQKETLTFKITNLKNAFEVGSGEVNPKSNSIIIYLQNNENFNFGNVTAEFSSAFFDFKDTFELGPLEKIEFEKQLNKEEFKKLMAGFYTLDVHLLVDNVKEDLEGVIKFVEKDIVTSTKKDYGIIINTKIIKKKNEGNLLTKSETVIKKNIISRLFTSFSPEPDIVERDNTAIYYTWAREIKPGETLEIIVKTNWLFPFLLIFFIIVVVIGVKLYTKTDLVLRKRISFVRAKGGEFALKVSIAVHAKNYVERINIIDRLPPLVKVYEKFGSEQPTRVDEKTKRIEWNYDKLEAGEVRVLSYVIYSKVGVLGKFSLPSTTAIYDKNGEIKESQSNKAFFVAEQSIKKDDEDY